MNEKQIKHTSKFLSLVLRHKPETIGIELDPNGWTDVGVLIERANQFGVSLDLATLKAIVDTNEKKRFAFDETSNRIRASQGHSLNIDLGHANQKPPKILYHGTAEKAVAAILEYGLEKRDRQHVHLSSDITTAIKVGQRHGKPVVFQVRSELMHADNFEFFLSDNGVWLTEHVPSKYLDLQ